MANATAVRMFRTDLGDDVTVLAGQIDAWLIATGPITLLGVSVLRRTLQSRANDLRVVLSYMQGPPFSGQRGRDVRVRAFTANSANQSPEGALSAFFANSILGGGRSIPYTIVDVSERAIGAGCNSAYLAFYSDYDVNRNYGDARQTFFAKALTDIAPGADANCDVYDSFGAVARSNTAVRNVSTQTWTAGQLNYIISCPLTGRWIGSAPCQTAAPISTPLPAYRAGPFPRVEGVTPADEAAMEVAYRALPYTPVP